MPGGDGPSEAHREGQAGGLVSGARILKYRVWPGAYPVVPRGAELLSVGCQGDEVFVWLVGDLEGEMVGRRLHFAPTGSARPPGAFVGRVLMHDDKFVLHVFDGGEVDS